MFLFACNNLADTNNVSYNYFSLDSLVTSQVESLRLLNPELKKVAILNDKNESVSIHLDSLGWEKELKVFRDANIDKPAYLGYYTVNHGIEDAFSNLLYDEYENNSQDGPPVQNMKIYYLDVPESIKKIEIEVMDRNELFESDRYLLMTFEERDGITILSSYEVQGSQKLKLNDRVDYKMNSIISF